MLKQQPSSGGRKTSNWTPGPVSMSSTASGINNRAQVGRSRTSMKPPFLSSPVFEGVYNNARMIHFLTAVVGSTCDVRVKNGNVYEGIFKTLGSRCELAVDAVHKRGEDERPALPRREEITDTMVFSSYDVVTMTCRDVDLNYATRDTFIDTSISSTRVNGEHKEKVLQRWEGGDGNGDAFDLENDASNGWDANEMFRYNKVNFGVESTYDSSLSMYTVHLERGSTEGFRQREARAARMASEIESSPQYRHRVSLENEEGKSEEDKYSAVVRGGERGRESPREREKGCDSPSIVSRESKYIPLPQRAREMGVSGGSMRGERERAERGPGGGSGGPQGHNRMSAGYRSAPPSSSSPKPHLPLATGGPQPPPPSSECSSPLSGRGYSPHQPQGSPGTASPYAPTSPGGPASANATPSSASPPTPHSNSLSLSDTGRPVNGVSSRMSPKLQRPAQSNRPVRTPNSHTQSTASRSLKSVSQDSVQYLDTSSVSMPAQITSGLAPLFPIDVNEILCMAAKDRSAESPGNMEDGKSKAPSIQQRSQIEELRKFGKEFRLQPSGCGSSAAAVSPSDTAKPFPSYPSPASLDSKQTLAPQSTSQPSASPSGDPAKEPSSSAAASTASPISDRQSPGQSQSARTPGSEESRQEKAERVEGVIDQVRKSTLNPNAKEFNPNTIALTLTKPNPSPTPPRPPPPSPAMVLQHPGSQGPIYNAPYLSYISQIHSVQPPHMYQYTMSTVCQGKYPRVKVMFWSPPGLGLGAPRSDHGNSGPPQAMLQAAASAAGAPLVPSPYPQPYLQYSQQQVIQAMTPYPGQPMYSMLQGGARMLGQGGSHPQAMGPQFPGQGEGPLVPQQGIYAPQLFSHHQGAVHQPRPSSTPTCNQPPPQQHAPSPGQSGLQTQSLYHSGPLSVPTPPNMHPGQTPPQGSFPLQGYSLHGHQGITHTYPGLGQITQAHVQGAMQGPHHQGQHGHPQVVMLQAPPPQHGLGQVSQHPQHGLQQGAHQHFYIGHPQAMQVQTHPSPFHLPGN
ncbi:ataxin-2-like protein isoform X1 [Salvelinus alpinus]|uniref:ataxin-2-like protein isoform X1 n=1 Tax=Salvelinus alpinus TaxID=8036 RepID=UPI0039FC599C